MPLRVVGLPAEGSGSTLPAKNEGFHRCRFREIKWNVAFETALDHESEGDVMTTTQLALTQELDTKKRSSASRHFEDAPRQKIVGQDQAVQALVELYQVFCAGLHSPGRPVGILLFLALRAQARLASLKPPRKFWQSPRRNQSGLR
jgi:hypothetical protein